MVCFTCLDKDGQSPRNALRVNRFFTLFLSDSSPVSTLSAVKESTHNLIRRPQTPASASASASASVAAAAYPTLLLGSLAADQEALGYAGRTTPNCIPFPLCFCSLTSDGGVLSI